MKIYRYVAKAGKHKKMHGIFTGMRYSDAHIPLPVFRDMMAKFSNLPVPENLPENTDSFWFTEQGFEKFGESAESLIMTYFQYSPNYIKEWDILEDNIDENDEKIVYRDHYQIAMTA